MRSNTSKLNQKDKSLVCEHKVSWASITSSEALDGTLKFVCRDCGNLGSTIVEPQNLRWES